MAMSNSLRNKLIAVAGGGAMAIAKVFLALRMGLRTRYTSLTKMWLASGLSVMVIPAQTSSKAKSIPPGVRSPTVE